MSLNISMDVRKITGAAVKTAGKRLQITQIVNKQGQKVNICSEYMPVPEPPKGASDQVKNLYRFMKKLEINWATHIDPKKPNMPL